MTEHKLNIYLGEEINNFLVGSASVVTKKICAYAVTADHVFFRRHQQRQYVFNKKKGR